jgi:hypothetical protein
VTNHQFSVIAGENVTDASDLELANPGRRKSFADQCVRPPTAYKAGFLI